MSTQHTLQWMLRLMAALIVAATLGMGLASAAEPVDGGAVALLEADADATVCEVDAPDLPEMESGPYSPAPVLWVARSWSTARGPEPRSVPGPATPPLKPPPRV